MNENTQLEHLAKYIAELEIQVKMLEQVFNKAMELNKLIPMNEREYDTSLMIEKNKVNTKYQSFFR